MSLAPLAHILFKFHSFGLKMKQTGLSTLPILNTSKERESDKMNEKESLSAEMNELFFTSPAFLFHFCKTPHWSKFFLIYKQKQLMCFYSQANANLVEIVYLNFTKMKDQKV